ncbi:MAG: GH3 auxin-responsive promoter family protein, partial [Tolypothrix sp. Co-bin9]|nr:GH3 auxin-responsive promoter family protein [Tolypothrix sp. Co-bin9]
MRFIIKLFAKLLTPVANKFHSALKNPQASQQVVQKEIFQRFLKSEYGKSLNIKSIADWHRIPIVAYHDIEKWILQQKETKKPFLTSDNILFYERTSGSRGAAKLIPYTKSLLSSFNQMFCVWAHDLIVHGAKFSTGKIY